PITQVGRPRAGVDAPLFGPARLHVLRADPPGHRDRPAEQHVELLRRITLVEDVPGAARLHPAVLAQPGQLVVVELLEQEQGAQLVRVARQRLGEYGLGAHGVLPTWITALRCNGGRASRPWRPRRPRRRPAWPTRRARRRPRTRRARSSPGGTATV